MGKPATQGQQAQLTENTASEISRAEISAETRRVLCLQTGLAQARGEVPQRRRNERQSFTSSRYIQLTKATALRKITACFIKAANVALWLLKISSQHQASASSELFKSLSSQTAAATQLYLHSITKTGKTARNEKIELQDPCIGSTYVKARGVETTSGSIHPNYCQKWQRKRRSRPVAPPQTACAAAAASLPGTPNRAAAASWAGNATHCKGCSQPEALPWSIKYLIMNFIAGWGEGFEKRENLNTTLWEVNETN